MSGDTCDHGNTAAVCETCEIERLEGELSALKKEMADACAIANAELPAGLPHSIDAMAAVATLLFQRKKSEDEAARSGKIACELFDGVKAEQKDHVETRAKLAEVVEAARALVKLELGILNSPLGREKAIHDATLYLEAKLYSITVDTPIEKATSGRDKVLGEKQPTNLFSAQCEECLASPENNPNAANKALTTEVARLREAWNDLERITNQKGKEATENLALAERAHDNFDVGFYRARRNVMEYVHGKAQAALASTKDQDKEG